MNVNDFEDGTGLDLGIGIDDEGGRYFTITDELTGTQAFVHLSAALADEEFCEFPAQSVQLQRFVNITHAEPQISPVQTDVCGNAIGYNE